MEPTGFRKLSAGTCRRASPGAGRRRLLKESKVVIDLEELRAQIQHNCDVSDAAYGGVYSLCGFLLRLRDLYKWEHGIAPWHEAEPAEVLEWVDRRENYWDEIVEEELRPVRIGEDDFEPFDMKGVNAVIRPLGYVYGAGLVAGMKPSFFLAELQEHHSLGELEVDVLGRELARDLFATPAMCQGRQIFARRSCMLYYLWDLIQEWRPSAREALTFALRQYGLDAGEVRAHPDRFAGELRRIADTELATWVYHEVGEARENTFSGQLWHEIVAAYANSPVEIYARVIKDLIADTHEEGLLGYIIRKDRKSSLGFYFSFMRPFTRMFFPEFAEAFKEFLASGDWRPIEKARSDGHEKVKGHAAALIELHDRGRTRGTEWARSRILSDLIEPLGIFKDTDLEGRPGDTPATGNPDRAIGD
jgi:hypothetical protein